MGRLIALLTLLCGPALASDRDYIEIHPNGVGEALVIYYNGAARMSDDGTTTHEVEIDGVRIIVDVTIDVNGGNLGQDELAIVRPRGGYIAIPDQLSVRDGDKGEFRVMLPMF